MGLADRCLMTWEPRKHRWRKMFQGRLYTISCVQLGCPETKVDSHQAANAWWGKKKLEIEGAPQSPHEHILTDLELEQDLARNLGALPEAEEIHQKIMLVRAMEDEASTDIEAMLVGDEDSEENSVLERLAMARRAGIAIPDRMDENLLHYLFGNTRVRLDRRLRREDRPAPKHPGVKTVSGQIEVYLALEKSRLQSGLISVSEFDTIQRCLNEFRDWVGGNNGIECLDADRIEAWWSYLLNQTVSVEYKKKKLRFAKSLVSWLVEKGLLAMPPNLHSRRHRFGGGAKAIPTIPIEDARNLILAAPGQLRLHLFLMANCGMTQQDVSDLKPTEVDWKAGRIKRKRSKTEDHEDVPVVDYPLWPETWELLRKFGKMDGEHALLTESGRTWVRDFIKENGKRSKVDAIKSNYVHLQRKKKLDYPMKLFRKTSATLLEKCYGDNIVTMFLGHAPNTVASRHYSAPDPTKFDEAVISLRGEYGFR